MLTRHHGSHRQRGHRRLVAGATALLAAAGLATGASTASAHNPADGTRGAEATSAPTSASSTPSTASTASTSSGTPDSWRVDLSHSGADDVNVHWSRSRLRIGDRNVSPASVGAGKPYGSDLSPVHTLHHAADRVTTRLRADVPSGTRVTVDVRGRRGNDGTWTEWREAERGTPAELPREVTQVQARVTLWGDAEGDSPTVRSLRLTADSGGSSGGQGERDSASARATSEGAFTATVYATREGLVGHTTANGHVIQPNDHFVALPSRRALSPKGSYQYSVRVCGPARCETAPVWDLGPWNTHDDYWNPSAIREQWKDLPRGLPEAQAAYQDGYNGGRDQYGRLVSNPAGIDLADGTFYNIGLNDNGWVTVTYLWTGGDGDTKSFPTWGTGVNIRKEATTDSAVVGNLPGPTSVNVKCQIHGQLVNYDGYSNDAWSYLPDYGGYISNIFIDVSQGWLPGVPTC